MLNLVGGASFMEAVYTAIEEEPENKYCKRIVELGAPDVLIIMNRTPTDAKLYIASQGNVCVGIGSGTNFIEVMEMVTQVEDGFKAYMKKKKEMAAIDGSDQEDDGDGLPDEPELDRHGNLIVTASKGGGVPDPAAPGHHQNRESKEAKAKAKRSQAGWESSYWTYIQKNFPGSFGSFAEYDRTKIVYRKLRDLDLWLSFKSYCEENVDFVNPKLDKKQVMIVLHACLRALGDKTDHIPALKELLKFCLPTVDGIEHVIQTSRDIHKVVQLNAQMHESAVFKLAKKAECDARAAVSVPAVSSAGGADSSIAAVVAGGNVSAGSVSSAGGDGSGTGSVGGSVAAAVAVAGGDGDGEVTTGAVAAATAAVATALGEATAAVATDLGAATAAVVAGGLAEVAADTAEAPDPKRRRFRR